MAWGSCSPRACATLDASEAVSAREGGKIRGLHLRPGLVDNRPVTTGLDRELSRKERGIGDPGLALSPRTFHGSLKLRDDIRKMARGDFQPHSIPQEAQDRG